VRGWFERWRSAKADVSEERRIASTYEVGEFSIKHSLSILEARRILREAGQSREEADAAALRAKLRHLMSDPPYRPDGNTSGT
jgi:hypothetical protein